MHPPIPLIPPISNARRVALKLTASVLAAPLVSGCGGSGAEAAAVTVASPASVTDAINSFGAMAPARKAEKITSSVRQAEITTAETSGW